MSETAIRFSGSGGQGLITAGIIFSEAASADGYYITQTQNYGPEARGGASRTDVIYSTEEIAYPKPTSLDILIALTQESVDKFFGDLKDGGILIVDSTLVGSMPCSTGIAIPFTRLAREKIGNVLTANIIALGATAAFLKDFNVESIEKAILGRFNKSVQEMNVKAFQLGFAEGKAALKAYKMNSDVCPAEELEG
jgi:2-oxoglutarate ferredoxin oxidoreductase subunit gamma